MAKHGTVGDKVHENQYRRDLPSHRRPVRSYQDSARNRSCLLGVAGHDSSSNLSRIAAHDGRTSEMSESKQRSRWRITPVAKQLQGLTLQTIKAAA